MNPTIIFELEEILKKTFQFIITCLLCLFALECLTISTKAEPFEEKEHYVLVIDPGHGGENTGTEEGLFQEKEMTMRTAFRLKEELEQFENVSVYLTHIVDEDMSLKERAAYAKEMNADYLISIHYNASVKHDLFGAEVWIPSGNKLMKKSYGLGLSFLEELQNAGLFIRGIKMKLNDSNLDYYGIIREAAVFDIPALIFEHCHVDEERDSIYCDTEEKQEEFACMDAVAIAKYLNLKKKDTDQYFEMLSYDIPNLEIDETEPEFCTVEIEEAKYDELKAVVKVVSADFDSPLMYYDYSIDGGMTFSKLLPWPDCNTLTGEYKDTFLLELDIPEGLQPTVIVRAYNQYDKCKQSNALLFSKHFYIPKEEIIEEVINDLEEVMLVPEEETEKKTFWDFTNSIASGDDGSPKFSSFISVCIIFVVLFVAIALTALFISKLNRHKKKRRRKK